MKGTNQMRLAIRFLVAALWSVSVAPQLAAAPATLTADSVQKSAVEWFDRMRTGQIDRTQLTAEYNAQLTNETVETTSRFLQAHGYVGSPTEAKLIDTRTAEDQTLYTVKLSFAGGNAANLQIAVDGDGKIGDISLLSPGGD
jgi:hypothetical protein